MASSAFRSRVVALAERRPEPRGIVARANGGEGAARRYAGELARVADLDDLGVVLAEKGGELGEVARAGHAGFVDERDQRSADWEVFAGAGENAADSGRWNARVLEFARGAGGGCCADDMVAGSSVGAGDDTRGGGLSGACERFDVLDRVSAGGDLPNHVALLVVEGGARARDVVDELGVRMASCASRPSVCEIEQRLLVSEEITRRVPLVSERDDVVVLEELVCEALEFWDGEPLLGGVRDCAHGFSACEGGVAFS